MHSENTFSTRRRLQAMIEAQNRLKHGPSITLQDGEYLGNHHGEQVIYASSDPTELPSMPSPDTYVVAIEAIHQDPVVHQTSERATPTFTQPEPVVQQPRQSFSYPYRDADEAATAMIAAQPFVDNHPRPDATTSIYTDDYTRSYNPQPARIDDFFDEKFYDERKGYNPHSYDYEEEPSERELRRRRYKRALTMFGVAAVGWSAFTFSAYAGTYVATREGDTMTNIKEWVSDKELIEQSHELPPYEQRYLSITSNVASLSKILGVLK